MKLKKIREAVVKQAQKKGCPECSCLSGHEEWCSKRKKPKDIGRRDEKH